MVLSVHEDGKAFMYKILTENIGLNMILLLK